MLPLPVSSTHGTCYSVLQSSVLIHSEPEGHGIPHGYGLPSCRPGVQRGIRAINRNTFSLQPWLNPSTISGFSIWPEGVTRKDTRTVPLNAGVAGVGGIFQVAGQKPVQSFDTARKRRHFFDGDVLACRKGRTVAGGRGRMGRLALGKEVAAKAQEA